MVPSLVNDKDMVYCIGGRTGGGLAVRAGGQSDFLVEMEPGREWEARQALLRKNLAPGSTRPT